MVVEWGVGRETKVSEAIQRESEVSVARNREYARAIKIIVGISRK